MITVVYTGGSAEVHLPQHGIGAQRLVPVDVPDDVAGREPGDWRPATVEDIPTDGAPSGFSTAGWPMRPAPDLADVPWEVMDPGQGLLAQVDTWTRPGSPVHRAALAADEARRQELTRPAAPLPAPVAATAGEED